MKRILFIVIPEKGHINPCIGVAQHLESMGHAISFYSAGDIREQLAGAGFDDFRGPTDKVEVNQGAVFTE